MIAPGFQLRTTDKHIIRFSYYLPVAEVTSTAFGGTLPFTRTFMHARVSGQEVWTDAAPLLDIIQENASVFTVAGEVVLGPQYPARVKNAGCLGIYYGEGKGLDAANVFAIVYPEDMPMLQMLGERIWKEGFEELTFEQLDEPA